MHIHKYFGGFGAFFCSDIAVCCKCGKQISEDHIPLLSKFIPWSSEGDRYHNRQYPFITTGNFTNEKGMTGYYNRKGKLIPATHLYIETIQSGE